MPNREQPMGLVLAPPIYPAHGYAGTGEIVRVRVGRRTVGWLSRRTPDDVGWLPAPSDNLLVGIVRTQVQALLREGAAAKAPLVAVWAEILDQVQHDAPYRGDLATLR